MESPDDSDIETFKQALSGYVNNRILSAIYESSRTGREVKLHWD